MLPDNEISQKLVGYFIAAEAFYPLTELAELSLSLQKPAMNSLHRAPYDVLRHHVVKVATQELEKGEKPANDWSIEARLPCNCEYCRIAADFFVLTR
jgi:hypothetical protein